MSGNKYSARRVQGVRDQWYDSKAEAAYAARLELLRRAGEIVSWERAPRYPLLVNSVLVGHHRPDFIVEVPNGVFHLIEVKGFATPDWKLRARLFTALYPELPLVVVDVKGLPRTISGRKHGKPARAGRV